MIAVRISPDFRRAVAAAPTYFAHRPQPRTPQDLTMHNCANLRMATLGGPYGWEFVQDGRTLNVQVPGQLIFNTSAQLLTAALDGHALAYAPEDVIQPHVDAGRLVRVLQAWSPTTTFTTPAAASPCPRSRWSSRRSRCGYSDPRAAHTAQAPCARRDAMARQTGLRPRPDRHARATL